MPCTSAEALADLRRLLSLEARAQAEATRAAVEGRSAAELEQSGRLLRRARVVDEQAAMFGRVRLIVGEDPARTGQLAALDARPGAVLRLLHEEEGIGQAAVLARRRPRQLELIFDEPPEIDGEQVSLVVADDEVSLRRMRSGLDYLSRAEGRSKRLCELLLGVEVPNAAESGEVAPFDEALNGDQREALQRGLYAPEVALVHGPFGTGKTRVLVELVRQLVAREERVLCLAASNAAVDHLALSLVRAQPELALARTGHPARSHPKLAQRTLAALTREHERRKLARGLISDAMALLNRARKRQGRRGVSWRELREARQEAGRLFADARKLERQAAEDVLARSRVVCGTLTGFMSELPRYDRPEGRFHTVVVDEASQALTPALLLCLGRVERVVLAGDHRQLPPTVISPEAARGGLATTAFETLMTQEGAEGFAHMLTVQHRMPEVLMAFPSAQFYGGRLRAHDAVATQSLIDLGVVDGMWSLPEQPFDFIDTAGAGMEEQSEAEGTSRENPEQAALSARAVRGLIAAGLEAKQIGVISPYGAQVGRLSTILATEMDAGLEVDSVDGFQGREKEAIVFDAVRSNAMGEVGFLSDRRRLNVAITRARRKLIVVGDSATLGSDSVWAAFIDAAVAQAAHRSSFELWDAA